MAAEDNKAIIRRLLEGFRKGNENIIEELFSPNFVLHTPTTPNWPRGLEGARKMFAVMRTASPDMQATIEDMFAEGDKVAVRWTFRGTITGEFLGQPPTGQRFTSVAISIYRIENGKIEEDWGVDALWQTGAVWE